MMSQIVKSMDFTKTHQSRYLRNETLFFLQILINYLSRATIPQKNNFVVKVSFKVK